MYYGAHILYDCTCCASTIGPVAVRHQLVQGTPNKGLEEIEFLFEANPVASSGSAGPSQRTLSGGSYKYGLRYVLIPWETMPL
jgi:hypothetical protein